jgi:hypothetical protein
VPHHAPVYAQTYPPSVGPHQPHQSYTSYDNPYTPFAGGAPSPYSGDRNSAYSHSSYEMGHTKDMGYTGGSHHGHESGMMTAGLEPIGSKTPSPPPATGSDHAHPPAPPHTGQSRPPAHT